MLDKKIKTTFKLFRMIRKSKKCIIFFIKKDGSKRVMDCILDFKRIPKEMHPKKLNIRGIIKDIKNDRIRVYDIENNGWRLILTNNAYKAIIDNIEYKIEIK